MLCTDAARLKRFLQTLPQTDRYILLLSYADGLTSLEVSLVLDLPELTVRRRLEVLHREAEAAIAAGTNAPLPVTDIDAAPGGVSAIV